MTLSVFVASCAFSQKRTMKHRVAGTQEIVAITASLKANSSGLRFQSMHKILDGVANVLYSDGFTVQDQEGSQPRHFFSRSFYPDLGPYYTSELVLGHKVLCGIDYNPTRVLISFDEFSTDTHISAAQKRAIAATAERLLTYLRSRLPRSYQVTATPTG